MISDQLFIEKPYLQWHDDIPFVLARLDVNYAQFLTKLALKYENHILSLPVNKKWITAADKNPTGSRYSSYNTFLLDPGYLLLLRAIKEMYYFYSDALNNTRQPTYIQSWLNVHRAGQNLQRHQHRAPVIGTFLAKAEGSDTRYGRSEKTCNSDHIFQNEDGRLLMTTGPGNYHEVSVWKNVEHARVSYAFDIIHHSSWRSDRVLLPFDWDELAL